VLDDVPLATLVPYIDWRFFFTAWELPGKFPQVLEDPVYGETARRPLARGLRRLPATNDWKSCAGTGSLKI